jgi:hypothetical protein
VGVEQARNDGSAATVEPPGGLGGGGRPRQAGEGSDGVAFEQQVDPRRVVGAARHIHHTAVAPQRALTARATW